MCEDCPELCHVCSNHKHIHEPVRPNNHTVHARTRAHRLGLEWLSDDKLQSYMLRENNNNESECEQDEDETQREATHMASMVWRGVSYLRMPLTIHIVKLVLFDSFQKLQNFLVSELSVDINAGTERIGIRVVLE